MLILTMDILSISIYTTQSSKGADIFMKVSIGQDSHRFVREPSLENCELSEGFPISQNCSSTSYRCDNNHIVAKKKLILGGVVCDEDCPALDGNSDADVVLHALCNAISGITTINILGDVADSMRSENNITDSSEYVREALKYLEERILHISFSIECSRPKISPMILAMRQRIAEITGVSPLSIGITATSGEGLTDFGKGYGIQAFCIVTTS